MNGEPGKEYFSGGMGVEILNALVTVPNLRVAVRTSAMSFKGQNVNIMTIGEKAIVEHILQGSNR